MKGSKILLFIICLIIWFILSWSFSEKSIIAGICISFIIAVIEGDLFTKNPHKMLRIKRYLWFFVYAGILIWDMFKANIEILFYMLNPKLKLEPQVMPISTELKSETGITALANTITLIQGMATVDIDDEGKILQVHFLRPTYQKNLLIAKIRKYEKLFKKIFEEI